MDIFKGLDIALSMAVVYLIFSLAVTACNESIAAVMCSRARWLRKGLAALMTPSGDGTKKQPPAPMDAFYRSPYVSGLGGVDILQPGFMPSYLPPWTVLQGLLDIKAKGIRLSTVADITQAVQDLPEQVPLRAVMLDILARTPAEIDKLQAAVEAWFKTFEAQVTAWYRQKTQYVLLGLALAVSAAMNLDSVAMVRAVSTDSALRTKLVEHGLGLVEGCKKKAEKSDKDKSDKNEKEKTDKSAGSADPTVDCTETVLDRRPLRKAVEDYRQELDKPASDPAKLSALDAAVNKERQALQAQTDKLLGALQATGLPMGWQAVDTAKLGFNDWLVKLLGIALTAFALSLGAPFWFDLLKSLASIRSVGKSPQEAAGKKSEEDKGSARKAG